MIKVMLVDDEALARIALKSLFPWEENGFEIACEASNGKEAFKQLQSKMVDLLITDIKMPVMDGLALLKEVKARYPATQVVMLSAYEEFALAKQAMRSGAEDYILKSELNQQHLTEILQRFREHIGQRQSQEKEYQIIHHRLTENTKMLKEVFLQSVIRDSHMEEDYLYSQMQSYQIKLRSEQIILYTISSRSEWNPDEGGGSVYSKSIRNIITEYMGSETECECFINGDGRVCVIQSFPGMVDKEYIHERVANQVQSIYNTLSKIINVCIICVSDVHTGFRSLPKLYEETLLAEQYSFFAPEEKRIFFMNRPPDAKRMSDEKYKELLEDFRAALAHVDFEAIKQKIISVTQQCANLHPHERNSVLKLLCDFASAVSERSGDFGVELAPFCGVSNIYQRLLKSLSIHEAKANLLLLTEEFEKKVVLILKKQYGKLIGEVVRYIEGHYCENITLGQIAECFYVNPAYLSDQFKAKTGMSFTTYLKKLRIEKAKQLLDTRKFLVSEVSEQVGYPDQRYFSRVFKGEVGLTPMEYLSHKEY